MNVGDYIKQLRTSKGISQEELGKVVGVQRAAVQKWESGSVQNLKRDTIKKLADYFGVSPASFIEITNIVPVAKINKIPLIGKIACGEPILATQNVEEMLLLPDNVKADFALTCKGDSMIDARIHDGDIVFVLLQPEVENGEIAAVRIGDEATLKRFYKKGDTVILQPENSKYEPFIYSADEINNADIEIIGKATYFLSRVR